MALILPPIPALSHCVHSVWASEPRASARERVLPTGGMHLAVRLQGGPVRLFASEADGVGERIGEAVVAGARDACYIKDMSVPARSVGVQLLPGAAAALFGVSAAALSGRHVSLHQLWGSDADRLLQRLHEAPDTRAQLAVLQSSLLGRLRPMRAMHPAVAQALAPGPSARFDAPGISQRHFIACFRDATGLTPKRYARLQRFQRLLRGLASAPARPWAELALAAGYSDQSHCIREFREFAGVAPQAYRKAVAGTGAEAPPREG
ncbi:MAG TPA: helix-turn-helix domain-containing protein [Ideonella sp.]|nr:helix-turn-helix domain-containing protein [Ideonella sp.]